MKIDMHNHTVYSDSTATPAQLVERGRELGIIPIITDHNTIRAEKDLKEASRKYRWPSIMGEEILTSEGEITAIMPTEEIRKGMAPQETLDRIREQGALAYVPHPFSISRRGLGPQNIHIILKCDAIEVINGRASSMTDARAMEFAKRHHLLMGAGSDSHWLSGFGCAYVETPDRKIDTPKDLLEALKKGNPKMSRRINKVENLYNRITKTIGKAFK
jgi:hypothetical protein